MDRGRMGNFIVETGRKCFLCLGQLEEPISSPFNQGSGSDQVNESSKMLAYSLQFISRYLRMDTSKVFQEEYAIPSHLLSKVKGSMLKVRLCAHCSSINDSFSKAYRELEKIEMELAFSLKLILTKLAIAEEREKVEDSQSLTELVESFNEGKLQIAEALRRETMQKCSRKLHKLLPRVRIQNMTRTEVYEEKLKVERSCRQEMLLIQSSRIGNIENCNDNACQKTEINYQPLAGTVSSALIMDGDVHNLCDAGCDNYESSQLQQVLNHERNDEPTPKIVSTPLLTSLFSIQSPESLGRASVKQEPGTNTTVRKTHCKGPLRRAFPSVPKGNIDPTTGRHLCSLCPKHFSSDGGYRTHYKSAHLKVRYKCPDLDCKKQFTTKDICLLHHQSVHMQVNYKCPKCYKLFADKSNCRKHVRNVHTHPCASKLARQRKQDALLPKPST